MKVREITAISLFLEIANISMIHKELRKDNLPIFFVLESRGCFEINFTEK
jgi:hypothetical protein